MISRLTHRVARGTGTLVLLAALGSAAPAQETGGAAQSILSGSRLFGLMGCSGCHAVNGVGGTTAPDLGGVEGGETFYGVAASLWNHLPQMVHQMDAQGLLRPRLDPWEAGDLLAFLAWLDYFDPSGDPEAGKQVFTQKQCAACHQVAGVGGVTGPSLDVAGRYGSPVQLATAMWNHGSAMADTMRVRGLRRPTFAPDELRDLIAYLESASEALPDQPVYVLPGRAAAGRTRFEELQCTQCHGLAGEGGTVAPDLGRAGRYRNMIEFAAAMWNKAPTMTRVMRQRGIDVPRLREGDMADLVAYLVSLRYFSEAGSRERGARLVRSKGCASCHGAAAPALREVRTPDSPAAVVAALWNHALIREGGPAEWEGAWPTLTAGEMADVAEYLQSLGQER